MSLSETVRAGKPVRDGTGEPVKDCTGDYQRLYR